MNSRVRLRSLRAMLAARARPVTCEVVAVGCLRQELFVVPRLGLSYDLHDVLADGVAQKLGVNRSTCRSLYSVKT